MIANRVDSGVRRCEDVMYSQGNVLNGPPSRPSIACFGLGIAHVNTITNSVRATDEDEEKALLYMIELQGG
jgi:hypothetical protein